MKQNIYVKNLLFVFLFIMLFIATLPTVYSDLFTNDDNEDEQSPEDMFAENPNADNFAQLENPTPEDFNKLSSLQEKTKAFDSADKDLRSNILIENPNENPEFME
jgi:hypothetical protein